MCKIATAAFLLLWGSVATAQSTPTPTPTPTTRTLEALSSQAANRVVQRDLLSIFEPTGKIDSGMFIQLHGVGLMTRAFGTEFAGVCRKDDVTLWYAGTGDGPQSRDAPIRPYSIEAHPLFRIVDLPHGEASGEDDRNMVWQAKCRSAGQGESERWLTAKDARTAVQGALVLEAAVNAVKAGMLKAEPCEKALETQYATCEAAILANGDRSAVTGIDTCPPETGSLCYVLDIDGHDGNIELTIKARISGDALAPSSVSSISISSYIIVT